ncbi:chaperonin 10-like protein [Endogone sp. FLAS-F59071]|nr:chaperonin 10-like protein [Endogone sp. FLAS-F59071]|eukprot:RUS18001.1 chaperonin 10-like protein [Endogone sp. FLAS-F59071]
MKPRYSVTVACAFKLKNLYRSSATSFTMPNPTLAQLAMNAVTIADYGSEAVLQFAPHVPKPHIRKNTEVIIQVFACAVSGTDVQVRQGHFASLLPHLLDPLKYEGDRRPHDTGRPHIMGYQISGVVRQVGDKTERFKVGDEVVGEWSTSSPSHLNESPHPPSTIAVAKPRNLSHVLATAVLSPGLTAHTAITHILRCQPGESILILDAHIINLPTTSAHKRHSLVHHQHLDHLHDVVMQKTHGLGVSCVLETMSPYWRRLPALAPVTVIPSLLASVEDATEGRSGPDPRADSGTSRGANVKDRKEGNVDERRGEEFRPSRLIDLLGFGGRWCSVDDAVQIDPPDARMMFLRNASIGFVFEHAWGLAGAQVGRYLDILSTLLSKVSMGVIPLPYPVQLIRTYTLSEVRDAHTEVERRARAAVHGWTRSAQQQGGTIDEGNSTPTGEGGSTPTGEGHGKVVGVVIVMKK